MPSERLGLACPVMRGMVTVVVTEHPDTIVEPDVGRGDSETIILPACRASFGWGI
jgi:hypothetical protein